MNSDTKMSKKKRDKQKEEKEAGNQFATQAQFDKIVFPFKLYNKLE